MAYRSRTSRVTAYTDGCCRYNGQTGATGGIGVYFPNHEDWNISEPLVGSQTNNRAEITAVIFAIKKAKEEGYANVIIKSDSEYVIKGATIWGDKWRSNGWRNCKGGPVANKQDWLDLDSASIDIKVKYIYIPAHDGVYGNEKADQLAKSGAQESLVHYITSVYAYDDDSESEKDRNDYHNSYYNSYYDSDSSDGYY